MLYNIVMVFAIWQHESTIGVHMPPNPEPHSTLPPYSVPLGCPRASASYVELVPVIYFTYGHVYVSMLLSQIIPSSPSPTGHVPQGNQN